MVLVSIQTFLILFSLWKRSLGQPEDDNDLLVTETSIESSIENDSRQSFSIGFQLKRVPAKDNFKDGFKNREIMFSVSDKSGQKRLDEKSIVFDASSMKIMNYDGLFFGVTGWMKSANRKQIQVNGYFNKNANETVFQVEGMKKSKRKQLLDHRRIIFDDKIKLDVFMKTVNGEETNEVNAGSVVTVYCKARSTKDVEPKFEGLQFFNQTIKTNQTNKEIRSIFRAEKEIHNKTIWCVADDTRRPITIKVLHGPTAVRIKPAQWDALMAGGHLRCFNADGYPPPIVMWLTTSVPLNGDKFHRIDQTTNSSSTFLLKENAPIGSIWTIRCRSANRLGNFTLTVNFTVEVNQTSLLSSRLSKLEARLQQLQNENIQKVIVQRLSSLETKMEEKMTKMEKMMETMVQQQAALKGKLKEDAAVLRKDVDSKDEKIVKMQKKIEELSSKAEDDRSSWRKADDDLRLVLDELRQAMKSSQRTQEDSVGRLDKLAAAVRMDWFVWKIEGISGNIGSGENSSPFHSDGKRGYRLHLRYHMSLSDGLWLAFQLMSGNDDDKLQWPMSRTVLIEIIDEQSALPVMSQRVSRATAVERKDPKNRKQAYNRPTGYSNFHGDGFDWFLSYEQIKSTVGAIRDDAMTVRCRVLP